MSRESGEHSLSMLLVLSLWAFEFCLSFMEVLRGRLCSLLSILLWNKWEGRQRWCIIKGIMTVSLLHGSRCRDLQSTWETYGFGIQSCRAWRQCWLDVQHWHPSCSPLQALGRCHLAPPPEPQKVRGKMNRRDKDSSDETPQQPMLSDKTSVTPNSCGEWSDLIRTAVPKG